jgi:hypothetical protein
MKLISFKHRSDYGEEYYTQILHTKRWALLQASVSWNDFPTFPFLQVKSGMGTLLSIVVSVYKLGFDVDVFSRTWNFEYLKDLDVEEENEIS